MRSFPFSLEANSYVTAPQNTIHPTSAHCAGHNPHVTFVHNRLHVGMKKMFPNFFGFLPFFEQGRVANTDGLSADDEEQLAGATTPQPSGLDKRFPGISHSFQQYSKTQVCIRQPSPSDCRGLLPAAPSIRHTGLMYSVWLAEKDTPPATPRGTASTGSDHGTRSSTPRSTSSNAISTPSSENPPPVGPPKGKLIVKIQEARNLRLSKDPYVVCTFESNEFISQGPKKSCCALDDAIGESNDATTPGDANGGAPMAIPMKSRQSSSTSLSELRSGKNKSTTDPKWDHEAVL